MEEADIAEIVEMESKAVEELPIIMRLQNEALLEAILMLSERERYILLSCALKEKTFTELYQEMGLSYKGIAATYYRSIQKIQRRMGGKNE